MTLFGKRMKEVLSRLLRLLKRPQPPAPVEQLRAAVVSNSALAIEAVIKAHPELLNHRDALGATPLHWAAEAEKLSSVGCLVDLGADPLAKMSDGRTPAELAASEVHMGSLTEMCQLIHDRLDAGRRR